MSDQLHSMPKRPYRKRRRAELEDETRRRITQAAVDLHGSLGPARTTVSAIADRASVQRATVYRHFPDEASLFAACSAHWSAAHTPPDLAGWAAVEDPDERLAVGLSELYAWYGGTEYMLEKLYRDAALVPAVADQMQGMVAYFEGATKAMLSGRPERGARRRRVRAAIGHALDFETWRSLVRRQGLSGEEAIALMTRTVAAA